MKVYPSLISSNLLNLQQDIKTFEPHCDGFHLDVVDFSFAPNLTWGPAFINAIRTASKKQLFVHLMVNYPERYLDILQLYAGDIFAFHIESITTFEVKQLIAEIKKRRLQVCIALKPETIIEEVTPYKDSIDHLLIMSVQPGYSGQEFLPETLQKLEELKAFKAKHRLALNIAVDGGITTDLIPTLRELGVDYIAAASAIFNTTDPLLALKNLKNS